ncbi:MAG: class I SAM-dependent methyltransferase [Eubacteriales bacterium]
MKYNPEHPRNRYNNYGDREWTRLERDGAGELLYHVHMDILKRYVGSDNRVLEVGAGSGRYTKDLVNMCASLTVADISSHQLQYNKEKMHFLGLYDKINDWHELDVTDMSRFPDSSFDCVVCTGGVLNYLIDSEEKDLSEMFRVLMEGGILILGVMSLLGAALTFMSGVVSEKNIVGINATRWIFDTGIQDKEHYPIPKEHFVHMMRSRELDELFTHFPANIIEKSSAELFSITDREALETARADSEMWELLIEKEIEFTKYPGTLDCG